MKVLVADKISDSGIEKLKTHFDVDVKTGLTEEELVSVIPEYDALVVRSATKATRPVIEAGKNLKIIGRAGVGVDNVDVAAATERGIIVCNAPTSNIVSAAEHTLALQRAIHAAEHHVGLERVDQAPEQPRRFRIVEHLQSSCDLVPSSERPG